MSKRNDGLLAQAALFEEAFSIDWLLTLTKMKATRILAILDTYTRSGELIAESSGVYRFSNDQIRQKWLKGLSETEKVKAHQKAIALLKGEFRDVEQKAFALSKHYLYVQNDLEGCSWLIKAGDLYADHIHYKEAIECYFKAIQDLDLLEGQVADRLYIETVNKYMNLFSVKVDSKWTTDILTRALEKTSKTGDWNFQAILNMHMAVNQWQRGFYQNAKTYFKEGKDIARNIEDPKSQKTVRTLSAFFYYLQGRFLETVREYETSMGALEKLPEDTSLLYAVAAIGRSYSAIGQASQGLGMLDAIRKQCQKTNQRQIAEWTTLQMGYILKGIGRIDEAHELLADINPETVKSYDVRHKEDLLLLQALIYYWKEKKDTSVTHLKDYISIIRENEALGIPTSSYGFMLQICWAMEMEKYPRIDDVSLEEAVNKSISGENTFYKGYGYRYKALLQKQNGDPPDEILKTLKLSLKSLEKSGHRLAIARTRIEIARLYLNLGEEDKARRVSKQAANTILSHRELQFPSDLKFLIQDMRVKDNLLEEILKLGQEVSTIRDSKDIAKLILLTVMQISGAERGAIFLLSQEDKPNEFTLRAAKNVTQEDIIRPDFKPSMALIREVANTGKGIIKKINQQKAKTNQKSAYAVSSCICVPMIIKNEIVGVLYFDNRFLSSVFRKSDLKMFTYFAAQAAIAMDNAEAYAQVRQLNQKLNHEKQYYKEQHLENLRFDEIVGDSKPIKNVLNKIMQVADTDTTVLILGETGVGKELVARTIQKKSRRSDRPFICVNCSAFSESLIASELFGHEKGAFTGANEQRAGRFELADGGTLFLDEIGDIPLEVQVRLLRVLQIKEFERVGGTKTLHSDFRLIAATNMDLRELVQQGLFREDLYYRLNVFPVSVPPLRERKGDIQTLATYFLKRFGTKMGKYYPGISDTEMDNLLNYGWPGNVRELENVIERGVIMSTASEFKVPELKIDSYSASGDRSSVTLIENEKQHILWALEKTGWKISGPGGAAELLDINYGTLRSRMAKFGIKKTTRYAS